MSLQNNLTGRNQIYEQIDAFTYDKATIEQKIANANKPLNETNQLRPLTGTLDLGNTYYVRTQKEPIVENDVVNKKYADILALEAGAIKNQIQGTNSKVICTSGNVDVLINNENKLKVDADSIDLSQRAQYVGSISVSGDTMLVPKIYVDSRDNAIIQDVDDLATELRGVDTTLQQLIETDSARITQLNGDYQNFKTVTVPGTYMKKVADSHLDMGQAFRVKNLPPTAEPYDAISYFESNLRYMPKTQTLDAIPKPVANVDLNGVKMVNSAAITLGDIGLPGVPNRTLTTVDWVESRGGIYRDEAKTYSDGRLQSQFITLDGKISLVDSKKVNYTEGIDVMGIPLLDYNMGQKKLFNLSDGVQSRDSVNKQQLDAVSTNIIDGLNLKADKTTTYTKTQTDTLLTGKYDFTSGVANTFNISELQNNKADKSTTYTKTETDAALATKLNLSGGTMTGNLNMGSGNRLIQSYNPQVNHDVVNKEFLDTQLALKTNTSTTTALTNRVVDVEGSTALNATNIQTLSNNLSANYNTKTQDTALFKPIAQIESKIQNAATNSSIDCSGNNQIDIKVNGAIRGQFFQPTGQATTPLGLLSSDKLQLQSQLSSISAFGSKPLNDPLNTHGLYVSGIDDPTKNVQSVLNVSQGSSEVYLTAGHANPGTGMVNYGVLAANGTLQVSGGLNAGITDKQILLYANSRGQAIPIQTDGKMGYAPQANVVVDQATQFTTKAYVDARILSGPTGAQGAQGAAGPTGPQGIQGVAGVTGPQGIQGVAGPTGPQGIQGVAGPTGAAGSNGSNGTNGSAGATGPTGAQGAQGIQGPTGPAGGAGSSGTGIQTTGGYAVQTSGSDIQKKFNNSTYSTESVFFGIYDEAYSNSISRRQYRMATQGTVNYTHAQYLVTNGAGRTLISLADIGSEGTQCARLSVYQRNAGNTDHENENYLQFKPQQNKIEVSVPISMITEPTYTGLNLVTKNYVDTAVGTISTSTQNKIQTTIDNNDRMTVQCNTGQVSVSKKNIIDQLQFTGNTITQVSGNSLQLQRGQVALTLTDDGSTQNIGSNFPVIYSTQPTFVTSQDHLVSQRITDSRYIKSDGTSTISANLPLNSKKITGLANATATGDAVHFGQFQALMRSFGIRRSNCFSFLAGDLPIPGGQGIQSISADTALNVSGVVHNSTGFSANYFRCTVVHNYGHDGMKIFVQPYSTRTVISEYTRDNDNGFPCWVTNIVYEVAGSQVRFDIVYEPNGNDQSVQTIGYNVLLQEQL